MISLTIYSQKCAPCHKTANIDILIDQFNKVTIDLLHDMVLVKEVAICNHHRQPYFNIECHCKKKVRELEKVFNPLDSQLCQGVQGVFLYQHPTSSK